MQRWNELTLGDLTKVASRYKPFILVVVALFLIATILPGRSGSGDGTGVAAGASGSGAAAVDGRSDTGSGTDGANAGTGGVDPANPAAGGGGTGATGGVGGTTGGAGGTVGGAVGSAGGKAGAIKTGTVGAGGGGGGTGGTGGPGATVQPGPGAPGQAVAATSAPNCDPATGRVRMPTLYANPCVAPFSGDNGGATSKQGVTKDVITIVEYVAQPDPTTQAVLIGGGDTDSQDQIDQQYKEYVDLFNKQVQLYGRKVQLVTFRGTAKTTDDAAGKADAITVATQYKAFMSWGSANNAYVNELTARGVICICTTTLPKDFYLGHAPYVYGNGLPDENQAYLLRAEMIGKQLAGQKAKWAGDPLLQQKTRTFGLIYYETTDKSYAAGEKFFEDQLATYGVKLADKASYIFDTTTAQNDSQTIISKFASEGITSIIFVGDPVYPVFYTQAATKQNYQPEWVVTGSALTDTTFFARTYDKTQWAHAFGLSLLAARGPKNSGDAYRVYNWAYHKDLTAPGTAGTMYPTVFETFIGLSLAGPTLNPTTFRDGMFSYPVSPTKPGITNPLVSFGRKVWSWDDYNLYDDSTEIYWDNTAQGPDELNNQGVGMYRYIDGGKRYLPAQLPKTPFKAFDANGTVLLYDTLPASDTPPDYPFKTWF